MLTKENANNIAQAWLDAWNLHDLEAILSHYSDSVVFQSPFVTRLTGDTSGTLVGKEALRSYFSKALETYPALRFERFHVLVGVESFVIHYLSVNDLIAAEIMELDEGGQIVKVQCHYCAANELRYRVTD